MKKTLKKGFTIVELVIVIAVIAILAAVLIPTFSNVIKKANRSSDTQLIRNLNEAVSIELADSKTTKTQYDTMYDAVQACVSEGYSVDRIVAKSDYNIAWESTTGHFVLLDTTANKVMYPTSVTNEEEYSVEGSEYKYFVVTKASAYKEDTKYSTYAYGDGWTTVKTSTGFDVGSVTTITSITYENNNGNGQDVVIRSNSYNTEITINASKDTVKHYDEAGKVTIKAINTSSYHEFGATAAMEINAGHVEVENGGSVELMYANPGTYSGNTFTSDMNVAVTVTNNGDIDHAHVVGVGTIGKENAETVNTVSTGVTFDYNNNPEQNTNADVFHHVAEGDRTGIAATDTKVTGTDYSVTSDMATVEAKNQFTLNDEYILGDGETLTITNANLHTFTSSDENVAYILNGTLYANNASDDKVTITADNGDSCEVTVKSFHYDSTAATPYGDGSKDHPYIVINAKQMQNISSVKTYSYFKWNGASSVDASNWDVIYLCGSFDGNNVIFNNTSSALFKVWNGSQSWHPNQDLNNIYTISNLAVNANIVSSSWAAGVVQVAGVHNFVMDSVTVRGYIEGATGVAAFICFGAGNYTNTTDGWMYDGNITFKNCSSDATIVAKSGNAVGFIAHAMMKSSAGKVVLENSSFTGMLSATSTASCKYVCGNSINATITDNQQSTKDYAKLSEDKKSTAIYNSSNNGWTYIASNKTGSFSVDSGTLPENIGDVISFASKSGATKATVVLQISPNPGNMTSVYASEEVSVVDGTFTTSEIKYFTVRVNATGITETGIHGNYFDIVSNDFNGTLGSNTIIRITQYNAAGSIVGITNINFHDVN